MEGRWFHGILFQYSADDTDSFYDKKNGTSVLDRVIKDLDC